VLNRTFCDQLIARSVLFRMMYDSLLQFIPDKMTRDEREALAQRICNFYRDSSNYSVKTTVNYFKKQNIPQSTIYYVLNKYLKHGTTKDLSRSASKGVSDTYVHKSKQAIRQETYLTECINKRLLPFIDKYHQDGNYLFWPDLASAHYSNVVQERLNEKNVPFVPRSDNPPNVPQARPIETVWTLLEQKVYEGNWEAKNLDILAQRIKKKAKELDQKMLQTMVEGVRKKLRAMWRNGLYSF
jgi:hypothetical protein